MKMSEIFFKVILLGLFILSNYVRVNTLNVIIKVTFTQQLDLHEKFLQKKTLKQILRYLLIY